MYEFDIAGKKIGLDQPTYFIAEAGVNHEQNMHLARALIEVAAWADVDSLKVQTFKADLIITKGASKAEYQQKNLQNQDSQYEMLKKLELNEAGHEFMQQECNRNGITFLSTPHSNFWSIDYLDSLGVPAFKVGSGDLVNIPVLKYMAQKQKPIVMSTGMANLEETMEGIEAIKSTGNNDLIILHCTTNYPCPMEDVNLRAMQTIKDECGVLVGYSDHTPGIEVPIMATALGASMIEKHFTIDQLIKGNSPDHTSSLTPSQLKATIEAIRFVENSGITDPIEAVHAYREHAKIPQEEITYTDEDLETALGDGVKKPTESELKIMSGIRKSITAIREVKEGQQITKDDIDIKRPTGGFHPREYEQLVSNELPFLATKDISIDAPINEENCNLTPRK